MAASRKNFEEFSVEQLNQMLADGILSPATAGLCKEIIEEKESIAQSLNASTQQSANQSANNSMATNSQDETKQCPYCAEIIKEQARICRFCQMDLVSGKTIQQGNENSSQPQAVQARSGVADGVSLGCGMFIVLPLLLIFGGLFLVVIFRGFG